MQRQTCFVYMTAGSKEEARLIGEALVNEKLAACVNIIDRMTSIYRLQGKVDSAEETVLIAKTVSSKVGALTDRVRDLHSYECPCVVSLNVADGNQEFLQWLSEQI